MPINPAEILVRPARRTDIPAIVTVYNSSVSDEEDVGFGRPISESNFADPGRLAAAWDEPNLVRGEEVLVAELSGRVVGCVTIEDRGEALELINIDVPKDFQGRGIGNRMVRFVEERARQIGKRAVTLGTSRNAAGVAWKSFTWWQYQGYDLTGEEENEWTRAIGPGVREIRMRKDLDRQPPASDVRLRPVFDGDLAIFFAYQQDPHANWMAAFTAKDPADRDAFDAHWRRIRNHAHITIQTVLFEGQVVGHVASFLDEEFGKPEVTYWIGKKYWGRGIATKALLEFLKLVAGRPIYGRASKDNKASIRVLEKCGFRIIGQGRGFANARGKEIEEVILELTGPPG